MDDDDLEKQLAEDIGYALWRSPLKVKRDQGLDICRMIGKRVVGHLRRSLWTFDKLPPSEPHD